MPSRPREFHPEPLTDPDVILSHHPARVTARRLPPSAERSGSSRFDSVGPSSTAMTCPPLLLGHYPASTATTRQSAPLRRIGTFSLAVGAACACMGSAASQPIVNWLSLGQSPGKANGSVPTTKLTNLGAAISHLRVSWDGFWEECVA